MSYKLTASHNYGLFELSTFNREIRRTKALSRSMKRLGFLPTHPLHVVRNGNGKLLVKDGHHRFEVAKSLGLPVYYIVGDDDASIAEINVSVNPWTLDDFLTNAIQSGSTDQLAVREFSRRTGISLSQSASLLGGESGTSMNMNEKIKNGTYKVAETAYSEIVGHVIVQCRAMGLSFATHRCFVGAVSLCCRVPEFDLKVFLHRLAINTGTAKPQPTLDTYLGMIEEVYNRQSKNKIALAFLARKAARERSAVKKNVLK